MRRLSGPSADEVAESVARLLGNADDVPAEPTTGEDDEQKAPERVAPSDNTEVRIQLPNLPQIVAHVSPQDIVDVLRKTHGETR